MPPVAETQTEIGRKLNDALRERFSRERFEPLWAMEPTRLREMLNRLKSDIDAAVSATARTRDLTYEVSDGIAVIPLEGIVMKRLSWAHLIYGGYPTVELERMIDDAARDKKVKGIMLKVDSPGGTVSGTSDLADAVWRARQVKPVHAYASDMMASAAYWIGSQADRITADDDALVGSIGVYMVAEDWSKFFNTAGVEVHVVKDGEMKGAGEWGTEITDDQLADWQREVSEIAEVFHAAVMRGRGFKAARMKELADGRVHVGQNALREGLVDGIEEFGEAMDTLRTAAGSAPAKKTSTAGSRAGATALQPSASSREPVSENVSREGRWSWIGGQTMNEQLRKYLESVGLETGATEAEAVVFWEALTGDPKVIADALATKEEEKKAAQDPPETAAAPEAPADTSEAVRDADDLRSRQIANLARRYGLQADWALEQIGLGASVDEAKDAALKALVERVTPVETGAGDLGDGQVRVGEDRNRATIDTAVMDGLLIRAADQWSRPGEAGFYSPLVEFDQSGRPARDENGKVKHRIASPRALQFSNLNLLEMGRAYLGALGVADAQLLPRATVADYLMKPGMLRRDHPGFSAAMGTGDFPYLLENVMSKSLQGAYEEAPRTWPLWCRRTTAPDFKTQKAVSLSESPDLKSRAEGGEVKYLMLEESRETWALAEHVGGLRFTKRMLINDDLEAFARAPVLLALAAVRKEDDVAYAILTANAALGEDGVALFIAAHSNLNSGGAAVLSVASLGAAQAAMRKQKGRGGAARLNIRPVGLIVPADLEVTASQLIGSNVDPAKTNATPNPFFNKLQVVAEARLSDDSTTRWYLAGDPNQIGTVAIGFLRGQETPQMANETDFDTDDRKYKVSHTVAAFAEDFRGLQRNNGA